MAHMNDTRFAAIAGAVVVGAAIVMHGDGSSAARPLASDPMCSSSQACIEYSNTSSGPALKGTSMSGTGLIGTTAFKSSTVANGTSGIEGDDNSTSGAFDKGVFGTT